MRLPSRLRATKRGTLEDKNALEITQSPLLRGFSGSERLYVGIMANTARLDEAVAYVRYVSALRNE